MRIIAKFRQSIGVFIPHIISLLSGANWGVPLAGAKILARLSETGKNIECFGLVLLMRIVAECQEAIVAVIPQIVSLLSDINRDVSMAAAETLAQLSKQSKYLIVMI